MQVSVLSKNVKSKHYTGYVAFHVHIMYSPNHGIYFDAVEDDSIQMWVWYLLCLFHWCTLIRHISEE